MNMSLPRLHHDKVQQTNLGSCQLPHSDSTMCHHDHGSESCGMVVWGQVHVWPDIGENDHEPHLHVLQHQKCVEVCVFGLEQMFYASAVWLVVDE
jgi:hypothetical protein